MVERLFPYDVFISYRRDSGGQAFANTVYTYLKAMGFRPYMDAKLRPGADFPHELEQAIDNAVYFLLILTPNWAERTKNADDWVRREVLHAAARRKPIIQFASDDCQDPHPGDLIQELEFLKRQHFAQYASRHHEASLRDLLRGFHSLRHRHRAYLFAFMLVAFLSGLATGISSLHATAVAFGTVGCLIAFFIGFYGRPRPAAGTSPTAIEHPVPRPPRVRPPEVVTDFLPSRDDDA